VLSSAAATHQGPDCEHKASEYFAFDLPSPRREPLFVFVLEFRFCDHHFGEMGIHTLKLERERESVKRKNREENRGGERERESAWTEKHRGKQRRERERKSFLFLGKREWFQWEMQIRKREFEMVGGGILHIGLGGFIERVSLFPAACDARHTNFFN